jgi:hypothetical protein
MADQEIDLERLKARLRSLRASMSRTVWSELLVDIAAALLVEESGYIIDSTKPADLLFGYIPGELAGKPLKILIPKRFHVAHDAHWERYWSAPVQQAMGARVIGGHNSPRNLDIVGAVKGGTEKNLAIGLSPIALGDSRCAIALISERF